LFAQIRFEGNKKYKSGTLKKKLNFKRGEYLNKFLVESGKDNLLKHYLKKGYAFVKIEINPQELATGIVVYKIEEGARVEIKSVEFFGNKDIKSSELKKVIKTKKREWLIMHGYYNEQKVDEDVIKLQNVYQKNGHLDAQVIASPEFFCG